MKALLGMAGALAIGWSSMCLAAGMGTVSIPRNTTVGPQTISGPGTRSFSNYGTINGGTDAGVTATGSPTPSVSNYGTITSSTTGISVSGSSSGTVVNSGTVSVTSSSSTGSAHATGISESSGP